MDPIKPLKDLMSIEFPEQEYIVSRLIPESSITIFSGYSRSFKTYVLLQTAISIASGTPLFGQFQTYKSGVLMIDEENGERLLQKRLNQLGASSDLPIYFTPKQGFFLDDISINNVIDSCISNDIKLVIIDSLIRVHGSDENSAREMAKVFRQLRKFTEQGISVLVTQHNRKQGAFNGGAGNEMRGSGDILAAVDSHIGITRKEKWYLYFDQTKQRYDIELDPFQVKVEASETTFSFEYLGTVKPRSDKSQEIFEGVSNLLASSAQLSQKDILSGLSGLGLATNEHKVRDLLARWVSEGVLNPPITGTKGNTKLYSLKLETSDE
jgi:AAA domain